MAETSTYNYEKAYFEANKELFVSQRKAAQIANISIVVIADALKYKLIDTDRRNKIYVPSLLNLLRQLTHKTFPKNVEVNKRAKVVELFGSHEDKVKFFSRN